MVRFEAILNEEKVEYKVGPRTLLAENI